MATKNKTVKNIKERMWDKNKWKNKIRLKIEIFEKIRL